MGTFNDEWRRHDVGDPDPEWTGDECPKCGRPTLVIGVKADVCQSCDYSVGYW